MAEVPSGEALLERAQALTPVLAARAAECERLRRVPDDSIAAIRAAGFFRILQPRAHGGYELHPMDLFRVSMELAKGCPSTAWVTNLTAIHSWEMALLDPRVAETVWGQDQAVLLSSSYAPFGTVTPVEGGFRVNGRWPWSSGCDHCQWAILGGVARDKDGNADARAFIIPRADYAIDDTWHVMGLKGTGSKDIVVADAFVPEWRTHRFADSFLRTDRGAQHFTGPTYRFPFGVVFAWCLAIVTIGMAEGALEEFRRQMAARLGAYDGARAIEDPFVQHRLAEAGAIVRALRLRLEASFAEMDAVIADGEVFPMDMRVRNKWEAQAIAKDAKQAIELLFKATGGSGLRDENPMQRFLRDVHAATNHAYLNADKGSLNMGFFALSGITRDVAL
jgi:3-hydroxy-9,10-secoandrosta-1,3,5(10)-triene-9,17-dione monooxygenase